MIKPFVLNILEITVVRRKGGYSDTIYIKFDGPPPMPAFPNEKPTLTMYAVEGKGLDYVRETFNFEPIVEVRTD